MSVVESEVKPDYLADDAGRESVALIIINPEIVVSQGDLIWQHLVSTTGSGLTCGFARDTSPSAIKTPVRQLMPIPALVCHQLRKRQSLPTPCATRARRYCGLSLRILLCSCCPRFENSPEPGRHYLAGHAIHQGCSRILPVGSSSPRASWSFQLNRNPKTC